MSRNAPDRRDWSCLRCPPCSGSPETALFPERRRSGIAELAQVAVGASGDTLLGSNVSSEDVNGYEIYFGVRTPALSGAGVWINPQGFINPTSSPTGNPISPGAHPRIRLGLASEFYDRDTALPGAFCPTS